MKHINKKSMSHSESVVDYRSYRGRGEGLSFAFDAYILHCAVSRDSSIQCAILHLLTQSSETAQYKIASECSQCPTDPLPGAQGIPKFFIGLLKFFS
ncbi:hypothetical protein DPMN_113938 [Dreissena polymorpha]|uniref:Uncharacterized protein n=1 Tax=Dreissena polymorpha TaxID=45954 RepID=A0A9D4KJ79_DREPO|nr:hypothetical protein DPMN_113938 [Dreissena polymorpha]